MAIDWSEAAGKRIVLLLDQTYRTSGGSTATLRFCWRAMTPDGWADVSGLSQYLPYLDGGQMQESWPTKLAQGAISPPRLRWSLSLPEYDADTATWTAILTGSFLNRAVVLTAVEVDDGGAEVAREELFRGVCADRAAGDVTYSLTTGRPSVRFSAEAFGGVMSRRMPLDTWKISTNDDDDGGQSEDNGAAVPLIYGYNEDVDVGNSASPGWWVQMPMVDSSSGGSTVTLGLCSHEVDNNPVDGGEWLTTGNPSKHSGLAYFDTDGTIIYPSTTNWSITSTYPKQVTTYTETSSNAFVLSIEPGGGWPPAVIPIPKDSRWFARVYGEGSVTDPADTIRQIEDIVDDIITDKVGASNFWFTGWPAALGTTVTAANRRAVVCIPGAKPSQSIPKVGEVLGELLGFYGLNLTLEPDPSNDDELRAKLVYRTISGSADHTFSFRSGMFSSWRLQTEWQETANTAVIRSAEYMSPLQADGNARPRWTRDIYAAIDSGTVTTDGEEVRATIDYRWLRSETAASWGAVGAVLLGHLAQTTHTVRSTFGYHGLAVRLGELVEWDHPLGSLLSGGATGLCWGRSLKFGGDLGAPSLTVEVVTKHGDWSY